MPVVHNMAAADQQPRPRIRLQAPEDLSVAPARPLSLPAPETLGVGLPPPIMPARVDWNGAQNFIRSIDEASAAGYHVIETFWNYVERWEKNPQGLKDELDRRNLKLETVSNGGRKIGRAHV